MTTFTRLTVVGTVRRVDLVVPDDEPLAALVPELLALVGDEATFLGSSVELVRRTGDQLDQTSTVAELGVPDGDVLRLVRSDEAPAPPEVADVTDVVAGALEERTDRWGETSRQVMGCIAAGAAAALLGAAAPSSGEPAAAVVVGVAYLVALTVAAVAGRFRTPWIRRVATAAALGLVAQTAGAIVDEVVGGLEAPAGAWLLVAAVLAWTALGVGFGLATAHRPAIVGAGVGAALAAGALGLVSLPLPAGSAAAIIGIVAVMGVGAVPVMALTSSGLSRLDDAAIAGALPSRRSVAASLEDAYATLGWLTVALAVTAGAASVALVLTDDVFALLLGIALALVLALRARLVPLALPALALWIAAAAVALAVALAPVIPAPYAPLAPVVVLAAAVLLVGIRPSPHGRVRLRRWGNALEIIAVLATVPLALGVFGLYRDLLEVFG